MIWQSKWSNVRDMVIWVAVSSSALAAPTDAINDCNSQEIPRKLAGCTALIAQQGLDDRTKAIAYSRRSDAQLASGRIDQCIDDRRAALAIQSDDSVYRRRLSDVFQMRAQLSLQKNKRAAALEDLGRAIDADQTNHGALFARASLYLTNHDEERAIQDLRAAIEHATDNRAYRALLGKLFETRAVAQLLKKEYGNAAAEYAAALDADPGNTSLFLARAAMKENLNDIDGALKDYAEAIRLDAAREEAYLRRARLYYGFSAAAAIPDLHEVIKRNPKHIQALLLRALAYEENAQWKDAIADYRAILEIDPSNRLARVNVVRAQKRQDESKD